MYLTGKSPYIFQSFNIESFHEFKHCHILETHSEHLSRHFSLFKLESGDPVQSTALTSNKRNNILTAGVFSGQT